jgi:hypothetical protein
MENWGGITFYESYLLFDPANSSELTKQNIFNLIAHEMAHQWFGDLVTMRGGITHGSTKDSPPGWERNAWIILTHTGTSGFDQTPTSSAMNTDALSATHYPAGSDDGK